MNTARSRPTFSLLAAAAACLFLAASSASAQRPPNALSPRGYERMRQLARELDREAQHTNDQARHRESWFYRSDPEFLRAVSAFARRAGQFRARMDRYRTAPWQVDDELRSLLADADRIQSRLERSRYADEHTVADWNQVVRLLNEMIRLYQADTRPEPDSRRYERAPANPSGSAPRRSTGPYDYGPGDVGSLAHELAQRAARVAGATRLPANPSPFDSSAKAPRGAIRRFAEQAGALDDRLEAGYRIDLREEVARLAESARAADLELRAENLSGETRADWSAAMQDLDRLRALVGQ